MEPQRKELLPIEPLPEETWRRIEANVEAELDVGVAHRAVARGTWIPRVAIGAGVALAAAAAAVIAIGVMDGAESPQSAPARIVTGEGAVRTTAGDVQIDVAAASALLVVGTETDGFTIVLERGSAEFAVPSRGDRAPFRVQAGAVLVEVVGTRFSVTRASERARVAVSEGVVLVRAEGREWTVHSGERWPVEEHADSAAAPNEPAWMYLERDEPQVDVSERRARRLRLAEPSEEVRDETVVRPPLPEPTEQQHDEPTEQERFERAASLEVAAPQEALAIYRTLAQGRGPWAANALYAAGRLELERGRTAQARRLFESYLARYPSGANARDVRGLLERGP